MHSPACSPAFRETVRVVHSVFRCAIRHVQQVYIERNSMATQDASYFSIYIDSRSH